MNDKLKSGAGDSARESMVPQVAAGNGSLRDQLQQFFPGFEFASEEEYIQGLSVSDQASQVENVQWLTFCLGDEEYALDLAVVLEIIKPRSFTELPDVPEFVCGILSLRGDIVPVIDLGKRLQLGKGTEARLRRIIICDGQEQTVGVLVDRITQVVRVRPDEIEPAPMILNDIEKNFISGVGRYQGRMLIQLNPEAVLSIEPVIS